MPFIVSHLLKDSLVCQDFLLITRDLFHHSPANTQLNSKLPLIWTAHLLYKVQVVDKITVRDTGFIQNS